MWVRQRARAFEVGGTARIFSRAATEPVEIRTREQRLWMAVLLDALRLAQRARVARWQAGGPSEAYAWIFSESEDPCSCRWVVLQCGWSIDQARRVVTLRIPVPQRTEAA